jgi:tryptophanyl-tRNA synthetase
MSNLAQKNNGADKNAEKILLSAVKPTGRPHIGNYFGAMKQFVDLQNMPNVSDVYIFIADLHALTSVQNATDMSRAIIDIILDYLAIGLDPKKVTLFKQSDVPAHTELAWIFNCITTMPYLMRAHAYKDAQARNKEINVGVFDYPMLMAADILLYDADIVPVGQDQKQHVEIARDTAEKFNRIFAGPASEATFKLPEPFIKPEVAIVPGIDGQKMSKSYGNTIPLFATDEEIRKAVMSIVTDSSGGVPKNVYEIHKLFHATPEARIKLDAFYTEKTGKYKGIKEALVADIQSFAKPLRERREKFASNRGAVLDILHQGAIKAGARAKAKIELVRERIGVTLDKK